MNSEVIKITKESLHTIWEPCSGSQPGVIYPVAYFSALGYTYTIHENVCHPMVDMCGLGKSQILLLLASHFSLYEFAENDWRMCNIE